MHRYGGLLTELTPFSPTFSDKEVAARLARVHGELILIHPFRDGNGRLTRLLCDLLLVQAGREPTHRTALVDEKHRATYLRTIRIFHFQDDLRPLTAFFEELLTRPS
jgi:cell filamentation protein